MAGAAVVFCIGLAACLIGILDYRRRSYLLSGLLVSVFAFTLPTLTSRQIPMAFCLLLATLSFILSGWIWWDTRGAQQSTT